MPGTDPRVDAYIEKAGPFARPILQHLRKLVHKACPQTTETIKWSAPHFDYKGVMCHMAAFKQHCAFGFWKAPVMKDPEGLFEQKGEAMGSLGRITTLADLPPDKVLIAYIREAAGINDAGIKLPVAGKKKDKPAAEPEEPDYFKRQLDANAAARSTWTAFSPSHRREYLQWIMDAKTEATRDKRVAQALEWLAEGKQRHWKYQR